MKHLDKMISYYDILEILPESLRHRLSEFADAMLCSMDTVLAVWVMMRQGAEEEELINEAHTYLFPYEIVEYVSDLNGQEKEDLSRSLMGEMFKRTLQNKVKAEADKRGVRGALYAAAVDAVMLITAMALIRDVPRFAEQHSSNEERLEEIKALHAGIYDIG